jgi:hypothetical protein
MQKTAEPPATELAFPARVSGARLFPTKNDLPVTASSPAASTSGSGSSRPTCKERAGPSRSPQIVSHRSSGPEARGPSC